MKMNTQKNEKKIESANAKSENFMKMWIFSA